MSENIFIASGKEFDRDWLLDTIALNADAYAQNRLRLQPEKRNMWGKVKQSAFDVEGFHTALSDVTKAIAEGKLTRDAGNVYTHSDGIVWDDPSHRAALDLVNQSISAISSVEKPKYSNTRLLDRFNNKFYGGNFKGSESDYEIWKNGSKGINDIKALLDEEISDIQNNDLDYTGSAYKNKDEYLAKLQQLRQNLEKGVTESDIADWVALGGDSDFFRAITGFKAPEANPYEEQWKEKEKELLAAGFSPEEIAEAKIAWKESIKDSIDPNRGERAYEKLWNDFTQSHWTGNNGFTINLGEESYDRNPFKEIHDANTGKTQASWFSKTSNSDYADSLYQQALKGQFNPNQSFDNLKNSHILREYMYLLLKNKPELFTPVDNHSDWVFINSTFDLNTGTAVRYDKKKRTFVRVLVHPTKTPTLLRKLKEMYKNQYTINSSSNAFGSILKKGGKLEELKILRAGLGAEIASSLKSEAETLYKKDLEKVKVKARELGYDVDANEYHPDLEERGLKLYRASQRKIANSKGLDNFSVFADASTGYEGFNDEDWARLFAMGSDITGLVASFTGVGTVANAVTGLTSAALNTYADISDDSVSKSLVWKNLGTNLALAATGFIPGGNSLKILKNAIKLAPKVYAAYNAYGLAMDPEVRKSWEKILHNGEKAEFTVQDWKNIGYSIAALRGVVSAGTSTYKNYKFNKLAGRHKVIKTAQDVKQTAEGVKLLRLPGKDGAEIILSKDQIKALSKAKGDQQKIQKVLNEAGIKEGTALPENINFSEYLDPSRIQSAKNTIVNNVSSGTSRVVNLFKPTEYTFDRAKVAELRNLARSQSRYSDLNYYLRNTKFAYDTPEVTASASTNTTASVLTPVKGLPFLKPVLEEPVVEVLTSPQVVDLQMVPTEPIVTPILTVRGLPNHELKGLPIYNTPLIYRPVLNNQTLSRVANFNWRKYKYSDLSMAKFLKSQLKSGAKDGYINTKQKIVSFTNPITNRIFNYYYKQGGSINPLKELRTNFTTDNSNSSTGLSKFLNGGKPSGVQLSAGTTWLNDIFNVYKQDLLDKLSKNGSTAMDDINSMQDRHHKMYTDALAAGNWQDKAFTYGGDDTSIRDYQTAYDDPTKYGYNSKDNLDAIRQAYNKGRYTTTGTRTSGDGLEHSFKPDNLYSSITDDRRILGRQDDWDENSEAFKNYQGELNQLGYEMYLDPNTKYYKLRPLDKSEKDKDNTSLKPGMKGDDGGTHTEEESTDLSKYEDILAKITPELLSNYRFLKNLINNKKVKDLALKKEAALLSPIHKHLNVYGDYQSKVLSEKLAADVMSKADRYAESTADLQAAALAKLEGLRQANDLITKGHTADNAAIKQSIKEAKAVDDAVLDYNHKVGDENWSRLIAKLNADIDTQMAYNAANTTNWNNYLSEHEQRARINLNDQKQRQLDLYKQRMSDWVEDAMKNDPEYIRMYNEYSTLKDTDPKKKSLLTEIYNWLRNRMKEITPYIRKMTANYILGKNLDEIFDIPAGLFKATAAERRTQTAARGGRLTVDSSRMKYRADDLRELRKQIKHNIDTNRHALDNLSKATLLELKKMMGI